MKKIIHSFIIMIVITLFPTICFASTEDMLEDIWSNYSIQSSDENFIRAGGGMGYIWCVDKSSLVVQKYAPPEYLIAVNIVSYGNYLSKLPRNWSVRTYQFSYNYKTQKMYFKQDDNKRWVYLDKNENWDRSTWFMLPAGEIAFYIAYNMSFYPKPVSGAFERYYELHK